MLEVGGGVAFGGGVGSVFEGADVAAFGADDLLPNTQPEYLADEAAFCLPRRSFSVGCAGAGLELPKKPRLGLSVLAATLGPGLGAAFAAGSALGSAFISGDCADGVALASDRGAPVCSTLGEALASCRRGAWAAE